MLISLLEAHLADATLEAEFVVLPSPRLNTFSGVDRLRTDITLLRLYGKKM